MKQSSTIGGGDELGTECIKNVGIAVLIVAGCLWAFGRELNPLSELPLAWRGERTVGSLTAEYQDAVESDSGRSGLATFGIYSYHARGEDFKISMGTKRPPESVTVVFLAEKPSVAMIEDPSERPVWFRAVVSFVLRLAICSAIGYSAWLYGRPAIRGFLRLRKARQDAGGNLPP